MVSVPNMPSSILVLFFWEKNKKQYSFCLHVNSGNVPAGLMAFKRQISFFFFLVGGGGGGGGIGGGICSPYEH